jgi:pimeloyl-ACP methyl ester carboxylesterase
MSTTTSIYKTPEGEREVMALYDRMLARWPVPREELYLPTRHGRTFAIASGDAAAPPLVLLHGSASNATAWIGDISEYSRHFRAYALDLPGETGRSEQARPPWNTPAFAEWLADVLDGLGLESAALAGISQGGWTALRFATLYPQRVSRLALLTPAGVVPARASFLLSAVGLSMLGRWGTERLNRCIYSPEPIPPEVASFMNVIMTNFHARVEKEALFSDEELRRLIMPVLLMAGDHDFIQATDKVVARLEGLLPDLTVAMLPGAGHVLHNTAQRVIPFLRGVPVQEADMVLSG